MSHLASLQAEIQLFAHEIKKTDDLFPWDESYSLGWILRLDAVVRLVWLSH